MMAGERSLTGSLDQLDGPGSQPLHSQQPPSPLTHALALPHPRPPSDFVLPRRHRILLSGTLQRPLKIAFGGNGRTLPSLQDLSGKTENLRPSLEQIQQIHLQSQRLEEAAYAIDAYSKALEARFKALEKGGS